MDTMLESQPTVGTRLENGAIVLAVKPTPHQVSHVLWNDNYSSRIVTPLSSWIVLAFWEERREFVRWTVWQGNNRQWEAYWGHYSRDLSAAVAEFDAA